MDGPREKRNTNDRAEKPDPSQRGDRKKANVNTPGGGLNDFPWFDWIICFCFKLGHSRKWPREFVLSIMNQPKRLKKRKKKSAMERRHFGYVLYMGLILCSKH